MFSFYFNAILDGKVENVDLSKKVSWLLNNHFSNSYHVHANTYKIRTCLVWEQWIYAEKKSMYKFWARFKRLLPFENDANTITYIDLLKMYVQFWNHSLHIRTTMVSLMHIFYGMLARESDVRIRLAVCAYVELIHHRCTHEIAINIFEWCSASVHIRIGHIKRNGFPVAGIHLHERVHHRPGSNYRKFIAYILRIHIYLNAAWLHIWLL